MEKVRKSNRREHVKNMEDNKSYNTDAKAETAENSEEYAYKNVISEKGNTRLYSVISLACAVLSVIFFFVPWLGLIFGIIAIGFSLISRKHLDYFEVLALVGLIVGIFGLVFSLTGIILGAVTESGGYFSFWSFLFSGI